MKPSFWWLVSVWVVVCLLKVPSLFFEHGGGDEQVYLGLVKQWLQTGRYSLQGSEILSVLPAEMYDRPLFHHPPLYPVLLAVFVGAGFDRGCVLVSWLGHLLAVSAVFLEWRRFCGVRGGLGVGWPWVVALVGVAFDPLLIFASRKLWMDSLLAGVLAIALGFFLRFLGEPRRGGMWLVACGGVVGWSGLLKLHSLGVLLFFGIGVWQSGVASRGLALARLCAAPVVLVAPWLLWFHHVYGVWSPGWILHAAGSEPATGFMMAARQGSAWTYWTRLLAINPVLIGSGIWWVLRKPASPEGGLAEVAVGESGVRGVDGGRWLAAFGVCWVSGMTVLGQLGVTYEMRYVLPALPVWYAAVAWRLEGLGAGCGRYGLAAVLSFFFAAVQGGVYLLSGLHDEFASFWQLGSGR